MVLVSWKARPRPLVMMVQVVIGVVCVCELSLRGVLGFLGQGTLEKSCGKQKGACPEDIGPEKKVQTSIGKGIFFRILGEDGKGGEGA